MTTIDIVSSISTATSVASGDVVKVLNRLAYVIGEINTGKYTTVSNVDKLLAVPSTAKVTKVPFRVIAGGLGKACTKLGDVLTKAR